MDKSIFNDAVNAASVPTFLSSKKDIIEYYRDTYGEKWKRQATIALAGTSDSKSREYKSAARNFQGKRLTEAGTTTKWRDVGQKLPPVARELKGDSITLTVKGHQGGDKSHKPRERTISVTLSGQKARDWVNDPNFQDIWDAYGFDFGDGDSDDDYGLEVGSVSA